MLKEISSYVTMGHNQFVGYLRGSIRYDYYKTFLDIFKTSLELSEVSYSHKSRFERRPSLKIDLLNL